MTTAAIACVTFLLGLGLGHAAWWHWIHRVWRDHDREVDRLRKEHADELRRVRHVEWEALSENLDLKRKLRRLEKFAGPN